MMIPPSKIFIGGLGYTGSRIASEFHSVYPHAHISGTVRSKERQEALLSSPPNWLTGNVHVLDIDDQYIGLGGSKEGIVDLLDADTIIQTVAPIADFDRDPILAFHGEQMMQSISGNGDGDGASVSKLQYVAYISSTGVYGNHDGKWVTEEESDLLCTEAKSLARVQAEKEWGYFEKENGVRVDCFRCGGIYGPGRGPLFSSFKSLTEEALVEEEDKDSIATPIKYVNRIMVDDISGAILTARNGKREFSSGGRAYNLVDDDPAPRREVIKEARRLMIAAASEQDNDKNNATIMPSSNKAGRRRISRGTGNKRCKNDRLKMDYSWKPKFPTFREGLASLMQSAALK